MMQLVRNVERFESTQTPVVAVPDMSKVEVLNDNNAEEVRAFLKIRPVHTVVMSSFITDNGLESELNRGKFYGYRAENGKLEGVALIGHTTLVEARTEESVAAFAFIARESETDIHVMMAGGTAIEDFWKIYAQNGAQPRLSFTEKLFELQYPFPVQECEWEIRLADKDELETVAEAHAEVAFLESGVDPMKKDREGFLKRCERRIEKNRTFVVFEDGELLFKADIAAETDDVIYLEGVYVSPNRRGEGIGPKCMSKLGAQLVQRVENISLLCNENLGIGSPMLRESRLQVNRFLHDVVCLTSKNNRQRA